MAAPFCPPPGAGPACGPAAEPPPDSLSASTPNAWGDECPCCGCCGAYVYLGGMGLMRQRIGHGNLAVIDPGNIDTGIPPPPGSMEAINFDNITPTFPGGGRATVGYHWEHEAFEVSGFYVGQATKSHVTDLPGQLDLPFFNIPLGFEGDNGLWLQADRVILSLQTALGSAEANYRWDCDCSGCFTWIIGLRYIDLRERFSIYTGDDDLTVVPPDPFRQATYSVVTHNRIAAAQLGLEGKIAVVPCVGIGAVAKGGAGGNFTITDVSLTRGDGFEAPGSHRNHTIFSYFFEVGAWADFAFNEHVRLRAGYDLLWVLHVADAQQQVDFDLQTLSMGGRQKDTGNILYHGPTVELQFLF
jgi:hypothetical protein